MPSPTTIPALIDALHHNRLTLLPTAASARQLRQAFDTAQRTAGLAAWEPAHILSWPQFLDHLWSDAIVSGLETRLLLSEAQEHTLWLEAIAFQTDPGNATLTSTDSLADLAANAFTLAAAYNAIGKLRATANTHDSRTFAAWAESFTRICTRNAFLPRALIEQALQAHIATRTLPAPPALTLIGFPDLSPAQQSLLQTLREAGTQINEHTLDAITVTRAVLPAPSEQLELQSAAHWIRDFILTRQAAGQTSSVGVLLPTPADAPALESVFREVLTPELQPITADLSSTPWEFASGTPLTAQPLIAAAIDLAHWPTGPLELGKVSALLLSPYLGTPADRAINTLFDANILRPAKLLRPELALRTLSRLASAEATTWLQSLNQYITKSGPLTTPRTHADWCEFLRHLITSAAWPGDASTPHELHAVELWESLLDQLTTLDFRGQRITYPDFLHTLTRQANAATFQPPPTNAPIQILPLTAAVGMSFDALILLRATDANFPPAERPNPLLSFALQASPTMPATDQVKSTLRAHHFIHELLHANSHLIVTFTTETPEGPQRLAPILASLNLPEITSHTPSSAPPIPEDLVPDTDPLPPLPNSQVRGGARVIQLQAACGFLAFAEMRLHATELESRDAGFDARESGNLLHRTLDKFWAEAKSQAALRQMSHSERDALLVRSIERAIDRRIPLETPWDRAYVALQTERLFRLLQNWLEIELQRGDFTVQQVEKERLLHVGSLTLTLRLDRIDAVENGTFIVDYKTGYTGTPGDWLGDRPDEPQLPLYALLPEAADLKGLAFAKIRAGRDMKWLGYQTEPGLLPTKSVLPIPIEEWRQTLTALAEDFAAGDARVRPKEYPTTCTHCAQRLLCRLDPEAFLAASSSNEEAETEEEAAHG